MHFGGELRGILCAGRYILLLEIAEYLHRSRIGREHLIYTFVAKLHGWLSAPYKAHVQFGV